MRVPSQRGRLVTNGQTAARSKWSKCCSLQAAEVTIAKSKWVRNVSCLQQRGCLLQTESQRGLCLKQRTWKQNSEAVCCKRQRRSAYSGDNS